MSTCISCKALPDEALREILRFSTEPQHDGFFRFPSSNDRDSLGVSASPAHSRRTDALYACKRWYRVGLPILYTYVAISSDTERSTLLRGIQADPIRGKAIRYLRLNGGYHHELYDLLKLAPNVQSLYITIPTHRAASMSGLSRSLDQNLLRPSSLYVEDRLQLGGSGGRRHDVLALAVKTLKSDFLKHFHLSCAYYMLTQAVVDAWEWSHSVETVSLEAYTGLLAAGEHIRRHSMYRFMNDKPLILLRGQMKRSASDLIRLHGVTWVVSQRIRFEGCDNNHLEPEDASDSGMEE